MLDTCMRDGWGGVVVVGGGEGVGGGAIGGGVGRGRGGSTRYFGSVVSTFNSAPSH